VLRPATALQLCAYVRAPPAVALRLLPRPPHLVVLARLWRAVCVDGARERHRELVTHLRTCVACRARGSAGVSVSVDRSQAASSCMHASWTPHTGAGTLSHGLQHAGCCCSSSPRRPAAARQPTLSGKMSMLMSSRMSYSYSSLRQSKRDTAGWHAGAAAGAAAVQARGRAVACLVQRCAAPPARHPTSIKLLAVWVFELHLKHIL
jgi:hypothetical protein